ncbi:MAG: ferritin [Planctomycetota bacterium]|nr:ferritin [Planctomycetota bacterium]
MLSKKIEAALNTQIGHEFTAGYTYLSMAAWFEFNHWTGFAKWMYAQREEELMHGMKMYKFTCDRGGRVELPALVKPPTEFKNPHDVFARAFLMEKANSKTINDLYGLAVDERDYMTQSFLKWFLDEQVEEENITDEVEALLKVAADNPGALVTLNNLLGQHAGGSPGTTAGRPPGGRPA